MRGELRATRGPVAFCHRSQSPLTMRGRECIFVMFSLLTLASILESHQAYALYAHPSHWMRQPKNNRFRSGIMATPEPLTRPAPEQKGTKFEFFKVFFNGK